MTRTPTRIPNSLLSPHYLVMGNLVQRVPLPWRLLGMPLSTIEGEVTALYGGDEGSSLPVLVHGEDTEVLVRGRGTEVIWVDAEAVVVECKITDR